MDIKYQFASPINHRVKNAAKSTQNFKNHFIAGLCSLDKELHVKL